jgi:hypothetical protein
MLAKQASIERAAVHDAHRALVCIRKLVVHSQVPYRTMARIKQSEVCDVALLVHAEFERRALALQATLDAMVDLRDG